MHKKNNFVAVILAAGMGLRLGKHTEHTNKCLLSINGKTILERQLLALEKCGVNKVILVTGHMSDKVKNAAVKHNKLKIIFVDNNKFRATNTLYSLALAATKIKSAETVIQLNGDVVFDPQIMKKLLSADDQKSFSAIQNKQCRDEEIKVNLHRNGHILEINKTMNPKNAFGEAVGINKFSGTFWKIFSKNLKQLKDANREKYFEFALQKSINEGGLLYPMDIDNLGAIEIDFPKDLAAAQKMVKSKLL